MSTKHSTVSLRTFLELYIVFLYLVEAVNANPDQIKHRVRRKVIFSKNSKFFFRLNGKENLLPFTSLFAHGWSIRVNFDLPDTIPKRHKFFKRNIQQDFLEIGKKHGRPELSCIFRHICELAGEVRTSEDCGFFCDIGRIITSNNGTEATFFKTLLDNCEYHSEACPYSFQYSSSFNFG